MSTPAPPATKPARVSPRLIGVGVLVIALGFGMPLLAPARAPVAPAATAADDAPPTPGAPTPIAAPSAAGLGWSLVKLVVGLTVVCGVCVLVARYAGPKPLAPPRGMEVLASITVGRGVVHLVRAGPRRLLIGTDAAGIKALVELPGVEPAPAPAPIPEAAPVEESPSAPARDELLNLLLRLRARPGAPSPG